MKRIATTSAGSGLALPARRWIILAVGMVALCLQLMAQIMPADAMQSAMRVAAQISDGAVDEAQSFAGTCLGFSSRADGQPAKPGNHASCPVCFSLAQTQGMAPAPLDLAVTVAWAPLTLTGKPAALPARSQAKAAFASRAPPTSLG